MDEINIITPKELEERLNQGDQTIQVVDVREDEEVEIGKIKEALHIRLTEIPERMDELDSSKTIVLVCRSGRRSERAAQYLESQGFEVLNMEGGMLKWQGEVLC
ncbi:MAG TPA: rhodanese-like domain-containing protein [Sporolactobacillaceae bacterium]|nr:rhodanese-like domain-containing protein [Sporolactobacillaceae bacterium]